jgi:hypothetical protein
MAEKQQRFGNYEKELLNIRDSTRIRASFAADRGSVESN